MVEKIFLKDALAEMRKLDPEKKPIPFSLAVRTYNQQNWFGGKLLIYHNATLMQQPKNKKEYEKNPNHWENKTRNIKLADGTIKKIIILFIVAFNGREVVY
jgi:hypothetical protein